MILCPPTPKKNISGGKKYQMNRLTSLVVEVEGGQLRQDRAVQQVCPTRCWRGWCWSWCWTVAPSAPLEHCFHGNHASPKFTGNHEARSFPDCVLQQVLNFAANMLSYLRIFTVRQSFLTQYWWSSGNVSGATTGVPPHCRGVAGRTRHIRRCESSSLPAVRDPHRKSHHQSAALALPLPGRNNATFTLTCSTCSQRADAVLNYQKYYVFIIIIFNISIHI